jgi:hypothetical protein
VPIADLADLTGLDLAQTVASTGTPAAPGHASEPPAPGAG